jgi:hypothetical protein
VRVVEQKNALAKSIDPVSEKRVEHIALNVPLVLRAR